MKNNQKTLLIVRLDQIGDYVLFRNFLEDIRKSEKYSNYKITLLGNDLWKNLAETFDSEFVDEFLWLNKRYYRKYKFYRAFISHKLSKRNFDTVISPIFSRELMWTENILGDFNTSYVIGSRGDNTNITLAAQKETNLNYKKLIKPSKDPLFEFNRNKEFFEEVLEQKINREKSNINFNISGKNINNLTDYVVIIPGAGAKNRCWGPDNFAGVVDYVIKNCNCKIVLVGGKKDRKISKRIINTSSHKNLIVNLTGKLKLSELPYLFNNSKLVITNDTGNFHIAAASDAKVICLSNGNTYERFIPYPEASKDKVTVIFPHIFLNRLDDNEFVEECRYFSNVNINDITYDEVVALIQKIL